jgi:hypothetical protein
VLYKCANPAFSSLFRSLRLGKLFLRDSDTPAPVASGIAPAIRRGRQVERYWLCDDCSSFLTLTFEPRRGMVTVPLPPGNTPGPALHLRQVQPTVKMYRVELKGVLYESS